MEYTFRPIQQWPHKLRTSRKHSPFKAQHSSTMRLLDRELTHLNAQKVVIQLALSERDIRQDNRPRADARPVHPGVILTFEKPGERYADKATNQWKRRPGTTLNFPCDTYATWQENMRAIALALEALRRVDRYGVTQNQEQYRGWSQLPPPSIVTPAPMSVAEAAEFIARVTSPGGDAGAYVQQNIAASSDTYKTLWRAAAMKLHPDRNEGRHSPEWDKLQQATSVMDRHHGLL
jgi:hypothetical protein